jgi:hypothetical protein
MKTKTQEWLEKRLGEEVSLDRDWSFDPQGRGYDISDEQLGKVMKNEVPVSVTRSDPSAYYDTLTFEMRSGRTYVFYHSQDCCESVVIEDITGELDWLVGHPLLMVEAASNGEYSDEGHDTWTFYKFGGPGGYVTVRWHGSSNGYYSESVDVMLLEPESVDES